MLGQLYVLIILFNFLLICNAGCGSGTPCIFMGKDIGWIPYEPTFKTKALYPPVSDSWNKTDTTLFVTMASFRDKLCPVTLFNLFTKAAHPERISVGVVQQNMEDDVDCVIEYCKKMRELAVQNDPAIAEAADWICPFENQIRIKRVSAKIAKGPTWGRSQGSELLRDEEFCMQTDSHMDYTPGWDISMMRMWALTNNEYAVLSTYVADISELHRQIDHPRAPALGTNKLHEVPHLCMVTFTSTYKMVRNWGTKCMRMMPEPKLTNIVWGAGLSFAKCHAERKVPYDPHTPHIFDGEEYNRGLRFWTHGYDIYTPNRIYVVHNYQGSQGDPKHSGWVHNMHNNSEGSAEQSAMRLKTIFQLPNGLSDPDEVKRLLRSRYGLGDRRTIDQAIEFSGIDTRNVKMVGNKCGNLEYVPWTEHPKGAYHVPQFHPETEDPLEEPTPGSIYYDNDELFGRAVGIVSSGVEKVPAVTPDGFGDSSSEGGTNGADLRALMNGLQSEEYEQRRNPGQEELVASQQTDDARFRAEHAEGYHLEAKDARPEAEVHLQPAETQLSVHQAKHPPVPDTPELRQLNNAFGIHDDFVRVEERVVTALEYYYHNETRRSLIAIAVVLFLILALLFWSGLCSVSGRSMKAQRESLLYGGIKSV